MNESNIPDMNKAWEEMFPGINDINEKDIIEEEGRAKAELDMGMIYLTSFGSLLENILQDMHRDGIQPSEDFLFSAHEERFQPLLNFMTCLHGTVHRFWESDKQFEEVMERVTDFSKASLIRQDVETGEEREIKLTEIFRIFWQNEKMNTMLRKIKESIIKAIDKGTLPMAGTIIGLIDGGKIEEILNKLEKGEINEGLMIFGNDVEEGKEEE